MSDDEWQPIETAPRDGTVVLLYVNSISSFTHERVVAFFNRSNGGCWWDMRHPEDADGFHDRSYEFRNPSHWARLPPPPKAAP